MAHSDSPAGEPLVNRLERWLERRRAVDISIALYLLAAGARLAVALLMGLNSPFVSDAKSYFDHGALLAQGSGYVRLWDDGMIRPSAHQVPGTLLFLALGVLLFGKHEAAGRLVTVLFSSLSAPLTHRLALRVGPAAPAALAGVWCALYPSWVFHSTNALSEPFFVPLVLLSLLLTVKALESSSRRISFSEGLAWGAATMVRPTAAPIVGVVALYLAWRSKWAQALLVGAGFLVLLCPWLVRNYLEFGRPLLATGGGEVFLGANNPYTLEVPEKHGVWYSPKEIPEYRQRLLGIHSEVAESELMYQIALDYLRQTPKVIPRLVFYKLRRWLTPITETGGAVRLLVVASYGLLLALLLAGLFLRVFRPSVPLNLVLVWSAILVLITAAYWGILTRGRLPLELVWIPWGSLAAWDLIRWFSARGGSAQPSVPGGPPN